MLWWTLRKLKSKNKWKAREAALKLGELKDARAVGPLVDALKDEQLRPAAGAALIKIGAASVKPLIAVLKDASSDEAKAAIAALAEIGDSQSVEPLIAAFKHYSDGVKDAAVGALARIGEVAVEPLIARLSSDQQNVVEKAAEALGLIRDRRAVEPLIDLLIHNKYRITVFEALGNLQDPRAVEPLIEVVRRKRSLFDIPRAIDALKKIGDARAAAPLAGLLRDPDDDVRRKARSALQTFGWQPEDDLQRIALAIAGYGWNEAAAVGAAAVPLLLEELNRHLASYDRDRIKEALAKMGAPAIEPLEAALMSDSFITRRAAKQALMKIGWKPKDDRMRVCLAVVMEDWYKVAKFGAVAVRPLLVMLRSSNRSGGEFAAETVEQAKAALRDLLKRSAEEIDAEELREIAGLADGVEFSYEVPSCGAYSDVESKKVDYAQIKQRARQELIRRGLEA